MRKLKVTIILVLLIGGILALSTTNSVSAARKTAVEFFEDLTPADRLHIRKAMDYAIPRQQIIDSVLLGLGIDLATPIERNVIGYDPTITAREFNITKALNEMEAAFGYRYNDSAEDREDRTGYFSMVIMCPTNRADRMLWAALVTK
ncbi:MAG: ABC transporter substrate-binding protein [Candidatus Hodarchaeales archaeon]|jgi:ABC-type transport system substrate-binding protein